jgi:3-methyladenine DNA glycosylase AlkD
MSEKFFKEVVQTFKDVHVDVVSKQYRKLIKEYTPRVHDWPAQEVIDFGLKLWELGKWNLRWVGSDFIRSHHTAHAKLGWKDLKMFGDMMEDWGTVDIFHSLAGPAWKRGQITDKRVLSWSKSPNRWWRRAALVCTVTFNRKSAGGTGNTDKTLMICRELVQDRDDMVVKAMSWALRELIPWDRKAVEDFLEEYDDQLAALAKREVRNKLVWGVKTPKSRHKKK